MEIYLFNHKIFFGSEVTELINATWHEYEVKQLKVFFYNMATTRDNLKK